MAAGTSARSRSMRTAVSLSPSRAKRCRTGRQVWLDANTLAPASSNASSAAARPSAVARPSCAKPQPASEPAQQSLIEGFKTKIGLLQDTVALINEMRKGNEAGAARIASGLKQKGT